MQISHVLHHSNSLGDLQVGGDCEFPVASMHVACAFLGSLLWGDLRVSGSMQLCALCKGRMLVVSVAAVWMSISLSHWCSILTLASVILVPPIFLDFALLSIYVMDSLQHYLSCNKGMILDVCIPGVSITILQGAYFNKCTSKKKQLVQL